jgi:uncharacterized phage infection (PIP) family protein YhgE
VRALASRSAEAAKEIKALIQDSVGKVARGSQLVDASGHTLGEIVASIKKVSAIVAEIAAASAEQSAGIEQVNRAVIAMDDVTQQNAALVEEAAAAAETLQDQARQLDEMMAKYKVADATDAQWSGVERRTTDAWRSDGAAMAQPREAAATAERRTANRPWSKRKEPARTTRPAAPAIRKAGANAAPNAEDWQEF